MQYKASKQKYLCLVKGIREYFSNVDTLIWDRRNKIKVVTFETEEVVVKSFKVPHIINRIAYTFFRDSKAKKSYDNSLKIAAFVPRAIGYVSFTKYGLLYDSYFLSEAYHYDLTIREPLTQENYKDKELLFDTFARFTHSLHEVGIEHLDYSPGNILIKKKADGYEFKLIDINRMQFRELSTEDRIENFSKLWAKDEDLILIIKFYAHYAKIDETKAITLALDASHKHKAAKNLKKRLKGKKVVD